jgi:sortase A
MRKAALWAQRLFFVIGIALLAYVAAEWFHSRQKQAEGSRELDQILSNRPLTRSAAPPHETSLPDGSLVGRLEIPSLRLSAIVFQGTGNHVLSEGVGHLDGSAIPGEPGNIVLAAHRDSYFRPLRNINPGDLIQVTTPSGIRTYKVDWTKIVAPTEVSVENPTPKPSLTLITCYPFYYVGHAPKRFIVRADEITTEQASKQQEVRKTDSAESAPDPRFTYVFKASQ